MARKNFMILKSKTAGMAGAVCILASLYMQSAAATKAEVARAVKRAAAKPHPRLIFTRECEKRIEKRLNKEPLVKKLLEALCKESDSLLKKEPRKRKKVGRRLLGTSREILRRVGYLSTAYRLTSNRDYLKRAEEEMLAAASFKDWNPSHYLDVAEMTCALAFGYDWLYSELNKPSRKKIRHAIITKGLKTYRPRRGSNNWNDVCNGGILMGALAVCEHAPELAAKTVHGAVNALPNAFKAYEPDGNHPEGPGWYWHYATHYSVPALASMESACGTDFDLTGHKAYMKGALFYVHMIGPTRLYFNYSDSGRGTLSLSPQLFWFYRKLNRPELLWFELDLIRQAAKEGTLRSRMAPFSLLWLPENLRPEPPQKLCFQGRGITPVATHRSSWTGPNAVFVGLKGGSPSGPHAHMDGGSFVVDSDGVRWAIDLGAQSYHGLEKRGIRLWDRSQDSQRWKIFRLGVFSHNTLVVNGRNQRVNGKAVIVRGNDRCTVMDLTSLYKDSLSLAMRGVKLFNDKRILVQDELKAGGQKAEVRWAMVTRAEIQIDGENRALLTRSGKTLRFEVLSPQGAQLEIYKSNPPPADYDAPNPGTRMLGFRIALAPGETERLAVLMTPGSVKRTLSDPRLEELQHWGKVFK